MYSLEQIHAQFPHAEARNPDVSQWSVGMHIHHCLLAVKAISEAIVNSTTPMPERPFHLLRTAILLFGRIPRGRGKAPKLSLPDEQIRIDTLTPLYNEAVQVLKQATTTADSNWFEHPIFGPLSKREALRFIDIHNRHHARIMRDICRE